MKSTLENDISMIILWLLIALFFGVRSCIKRRNGLLAVAVGIFTFSICSIFGEIILPIPLYYEPWEHFTLEVTVIPFQFDKYLGKMLEQRIPDFCYFLLFGFCLCAIFRPMRKFRKGSAVIATILAGSVAYILLRNLLYSMPVSYVDGYSIVLYVTGGFLGYALSFALAKIFPDFYRKLTLAEWPDQKRKATYRMDLE